MDSYFETVIFSLMYHLERVYFVLNLLIYLHCNITHWDVYSNMQVPLNNYFCVYLKSLGKILSQIELKLTILNIIDSTNYISKPHIQKRKIKVRVKRRLLSFPLLWFRLVRSFFPLGVSPLHYGGFPHVFFGCFPSY